MNDYIDRQAAIDAVMALMPSLTTADGSGQFDAEIYRVQELFVDIGQVLNDLPSAEVEPVVHCIDCITDETAQKIIEEAKSLKLRHCNKLGWAYCCGNCDKCRITTTALW